jgi:hypothetical protein
MGRGTVFVVGELLEWRVVIVVTVAVRHRRLSMVNRWNATRFSCLVKIFPVWSYLVMTFLVQEFWFSRNLTFTSYNVTGL